MTTVCPRCEHPQITMTVPSELSRYAAAPAVRCCQRCLAVEAAESRNESAEPSFEAIHRRFPTGQEGVGMVLLLDKLSSLALNRGDIEALVSILESNGVDLFLTLERLIADPEIDPEINLARRRTQLETLLS